MPVMPENATCSHCEHWYWYADICESYGGNCPHKKGCNRFRIKTRSEYGYEHYNPLPPQEIVDEFYRLNPKLSIIKHSNRSTVSSKELRGDST